MPLNAEERAALAAYRIEKAEKTFIEAKDNATMGHWSLAANRLYYAAYYISSALLISRGLAAKTHEGVNVLINKHFVNKDMLEISESALLSRLQSIRRTGDYDDLLDWSEEDIKPYFPLTRKYIDKVKTLIGF